MLYQSAGHRDLARGSRCEPLFRRGLAALRLDPEIDSLEPYSVGGPALRRERLHRSTLASRSARTDLFSFSRFCAGLIKPLLAEGFGYLESIPTGERLNTQGWPLFTPRQTAAMVAGFYDQQCVFLSPSRALQRLLMLILSQLSADRRLPEPTLYTLRTLYATNPS